MDRSTRSGPASKVVDREYCVSSILTLIHSIITASFLCLVSSFADGLLHAVVAALEAEISPACPDVPEVYRSRAVWARAER